MINVCPLFFAPRYITLVTEVFFSALSSHVWSLEPPFPTKSCIFTFSSSLLMSEVCRCLSEKRILCSKLEVYNDHQSLVPWHILLHLSITEKLAAISRHVEKFLLVQKCNPLLGLRSFFVNVRPGQLILDCFVFSDQLCLVWNLDGILRL